MTWDPRAEYVQRRDARQRLVSVEEGRDRLIAWMRLAVFAAALLIAWFVYRNADAPGSFLLAPAGAFFVLIVVHDRVLKKLAHARRSVQLYDEGLARLNGEWAGKGNPGDRFVDGKHPYAQDLDVFGEGGIFERMCIARTAAGEESLAWWFCNPARPDVVRARQDAVKELAPLLDLKEDLYLLGDDARGALSSATLLRWASGTVPPQAWGLRLAGLLLSSMTVALLSAAYVGAIPWGWPVVGIIALSIFSSRLKPRVDPLLANAPQAVRDMRVMTDILRRIESATFTSPVLKDVQQRIKVQDVRASVEIGRLSRILGFIEIRQNILLAPFAALLLWGTQGAFFLEDWRRRCGQHVRTWIGAVGDFEALLSIATYRFERPDDIFPEILDEGPVVQGTKLGHPLVRGCVRNDVRLDGNQQLILISGSNMSGKSTYLRTVGVNVMLALMGAPVWAESMKLSTLQMGGTLRVQDSLQEGKSRFYAEITRLKQVVDLARGGRPLLFLLDEILHGTNSHDRRAGAQSVLEGLLKLGAIGLCTTHDLALAQAAEALAPRAVNVHFEDQMKDGVMTFDYTVRPGVVQRSNALELMRAVGLDV